MIGTTLGHYRMVEQIGAGGMGVVYRAHDERLDRDVAIKVLPEEVAGDADRLARFEREAKLLASLNHPNIATLHGLEEEEGQLFLVMELVEGESLASVISRGRIPVDEALPLALQIARALEAAHERGIIHRDLKPQNVMVDSDGRVKVLDFGLAKIWHDDVSDDDLTHSPTLTAQRTAEGVILGTAAYMSPEQARGKAVDKRADIWAFGCTLYEILAGRRAFAGDTATDILAAIITSEPDWDELPGATPSHIRRLLRRCLTKDPRERLHDIADARIELSEGYDDEQGSAQTRGPSDSPEVSRKWLQFLPWVLVPIVAIGVWMVSRIFQDRTDTVGNHRLEVGMPRGEVLRGLPYRALAISPDGSTLAYASVSGRGYYIQLPPDHDPINLRTLDAWETRPLSGTEGGVQPLFSPDGEWLLFITGSEKDWIGGQSESGGWSPRFLKKISLKSGSTVTVCECDASFGTTWGTEGTIVFAGAFGPLFQVPEAGGEPQPVTTLDQQEGEISHRLPHFLPDGKAVVYTALTGVKDWSTAKVFVQNLETGERRLVIEDGADAQYVPSGHLVYARDDRLMAAPFDLGRRRVTGHAVPVLEGVWRWINPESNFDVGTVQVAFSGTGVLAYAPGSPSPPIPRAVVVVDREGQQEEILEAEALDYWFVRGAGNGRNVLVGDISAPDVWSIDAKRGSMRRQTFEGGSSPLWGPGPGQFTYAVKDPVGIVVKTLNTDTEDGHILPIEISGAVELLPSSWSPDARHLAICSYDPVTKGDIWIYSPEGGVSPFLKTEFFEGWAEFSPNGRWIAYASDMSGASEVYVTAFPGPGPTVQVSTTGGFEAAWSPTGGELFFGHVIDAGESSGDLAVLFSATIVEEDGLIRVGEPKRLFSHKFLMAMPVRSFDVLDDGRFLFVKTLNLDTLLEGVDEGIPDRIRIVEDWFAELERLAPTGER